MRLLLELKLEVDMSVILVILDVFHSAKHITTGDGGMIIVKKKNYELVKALKGLV